MQEIEQLEDAIANLDCMINEGVAYDKTNIATLNEIVSQLQLMIHTIEQFNMA